MSFDAGVLAERAPEKFADPDWTATRERRATVALDRLETLWINTGTLCNITCQNCYIESSPSNDRLVYITAAEAAAYLDEIAAGELGTREIGFTGGEPFMNPQLLAMLEDALQRGFEVLVLTNAMQPMQRPKIKRGLLELRERFGAAPDPARQPRPLHARPCTRPSAARAPGPGRSPGSTGWRSNGFAIAIAGRTCWNESEEDSARGLCAPDRRARLADRRRRSGRAGAAAGDGRQARRARRSPRAAGPSSTRARAT